ncbi:hypothetical protein PSA01_61130 [Pseudonocardia saturnea]|uniref:Uncharacterized protein n=1 Tax=Pseudonocardia saturnea TaxID=33909 RepID=A0ABQ0S833_9PSEU|nr:hypothetical protein Pdca_27760 [Pseudonocardia autotrophica]GEC29084.1 hypothetical protein PSA01_61130 [Pseudonocardia saturnea]
MVTVRLPAVRIQMRLGEHRPIAERAQLPRVPGQVGQEPGGGGAVVVAVPAGGGGSTWRHSHLLRDHPVHLMAGGCVAPRGCGAKEWV